MRPVRVFQVVTRMVEGGARRVVLQLLERLPSREFEQTLVCGPESRALDLVGVPVAVVPTLVREIRPPADLAAALELASLFLRRRPHVVHAHTYKAGVLACLAARLSGVPGILFTPHGHIFARGAQIPGVPEGRWKLGLLRWITRLAQVCAHRITALSEEDLRQQVALGLSPPSKYVVVRNGIDLDRYGRAAPRKGDEGAPVIGAVGRLTSEKGHRYLIDAFAMLRSRLPRARLVLVGEGDLHGDLREHARRLGLDGAVTFSGEMDSAEVLGAFDLFVQPSLYESQGMAILEAMAVGRPVVATDVGGVRDVVRHEETGLLVPPADPEALAGALARLVAAPEWAARMAQCARARVRELYSADRMVLDYARLYLERMGRYNLRPAASVGIVLQAPRGKEGV